MAKKKKYKPQSEEGGLVYSTDPQTMESLFAGLLDSTAEQEKTNTPPAPQKMHCRIEKKGRRGKIVTIIEGFKGSDEKLQKLARELRKHCGTGGSAKDGLILLQGDFREKVQAYLRKTKLTDL